MKLKLNTMTENPDALKAKIRDLEIAEKTWSDIFNSLDEIMFIIDMDCNIVQINQSGLQFLGKKKEEVLGKKCFELFDNDKAAPKTCALKLAQQKKKPENIERYDPATDRTFLITESPILENGKMARLIELRKDITDIKNAEEQIRKFSRAIEQSPNAILITDLQGIIEYVNPALCSMTGYTAEEITGQNPRIFKSNKQDAPFYKKMWETITKGKEWRGELQNKKKNGEIFWVYVTISLIRKADNKVTHYLAIEEDITEEKKNREALALSEERYREQNRRMDSIVETLPDGILVLRSYRELFK